MDKFNFGYSTKNIPSSNQDSYTRRLIEKTEKFIRALRWKAYFFLNPEAKSSEINTYGFNSRKAPPVINELKTFETKMEETIKHIEFKQNKQNVFQQQLKRDIGNLKSEKKILVKADKTTNFYKVEADKYNNLLNKNIHKSYKKTAEKTERTINREAKHLAKEIQLDDRIEIMARKESFVTLKDHKPNFENSPTCRLINPTKSELGKVSKQILEKIITSVKNSTNLNIWRSTHEVIEWFKAIPNKNQQSFICFDIVDFYPSISEQLLVEALDFASNYVTISPLENDIILHAKKTILINKENPWTKKSVNGKLFDVTMGSYDGAETCELVVIYMLYNLQREYGDLIGLYRDDGLAVSDKTPRQIDNIKKGICKIFREKGLKITIEANKKVINYLDVTLDLTRNVYKPYKKPNDVPLYVHAMSNHPPSVIKAIPESINTRLSDISSNEEVFKEAAPVYQKALNESKYNYTLKYNPRDRTQQNRRKRKRNIIWFNPPFDQSVKTNIGKKFLKDLDESFPEGHKLRKIFNRNTVKLSYSCMPNIKNIVDAHNKKTLNNANNENEILQEQICNCRRKSECPLQENCLSKGIVYQAIVTSDNQEHTYVGLTNTTFKARYANHQQSFNNVDYKNQTELSKFIWTLKDQNKTFQISWRQLKKAKAYTNQTKRCNLCIMEKWYILKHPELSSLNSRTELINTCRHSRRFLLNSV